MSSTMTSASELSRWFVSIKLLGETDYESHGMQGLIHGKFKTPKENDDSKKTAELITVKCKRSDALVTRKILLHLMRHVMTTGVGLHRLSVPTSVINKLVAGSKEWMKKTAESYTIIVAHNSTVVFAAAITLT